MTPGFAGYATAASDDPRPDADRRGRRRARRALPQRRPQAEPGGDDAPARRQVQPGVRRRLHGRVHARGRLHRARARRSPTSGSARPSRSAPGRTTTTGPTTRSTRSAACSARSSCARKGAKPPDRVYTLFAHQLPPPVTRLQANFHCINGRAYAGNTPTLTARVGEDVEIHAFGMDSNFHTFHIHGHRWRDPAGAFTDNPAMGPNEMRHGPLRRGQPGSLALPLPRLLASGRGHGGLVRRRPLTLRRESCAFRCVAALAAAALLAPAAASAQTYPEPQEPGPVQSKPKGPHKTLHGLQEASAAATSRRSRRPSTRPAPATRSACATASIARP